MGMTEYREDEDSLGKVQIPYDAYYGPFTGRAIKQYQVTKQKAHLHLLRSFVMIKRSAAISNMSTKSLNIPQGEAIVRACDTILDGKYTEQFVVDMINSGAGTAFNMNVNEVIANVALEIMHKKRGEYEHLHPNDHVNMSQSTNDTYPTAMHMAILLNLKEAIPAVDLLVSTLKKKAVEFESFKKIGRTHLMDALPVTLGSEFAALAEAISNARDVLYTSQEGLRTVPLGGTAVGSGANTPKGYRETAITELARVSNLELTLEKNMQYGLQSRHAVVTTSAALRGLSIEIGKLANDIRLMASGPVAGLAELGIPTVHAGSSIMPGKVNPSLAECMNMICFTIMGNDTSTAHAAAAGQFELNVMLPGMLKSVLDSIDMLKNFVPIFATNLIEGLTANREKLQSDIENSPVIVTLLAPRIGYLKSADLFKESLKTKKTIRELVISQNLMSSKEIDSLFSSD